MKITITNMQDGIYYSAKAMRSIFSGFDRWETREMNEFLWKEAGPKDPPYFVCAKFKNGRHIPVPILANWSFGADHCWNIADWMQRKAIQFAQQIVGKIEIPDEYQDLRRL